MIWNVSDGRFSAPPITGHVGRIVALKLRRVDISIITAHNPGKRVMNCSIEKRSSALSSTRSCKVLLLILPSKIGS